MKDNSKTNAAIQFLVDRWEWFTTPVEDAPDSYNRLLFLGMLDEFSDTHGEEAIQALAGFIVWAFDNIQDSEKRMKDIKSTIVHDLNGRNEKVMLPRTADYLQAWINEFPKS